MASNEYLALTDILNNRIKTMATKNEDRIQELIDNVNDWYESYAVDECGVALDDIRYPTCEMVKNLLRAQLNINVGSSFIGGTDNATSANDVYTVLYNIGREDMKAIAPKINAGMIMKDVLDETIHASSMFGRIVRA